MGAAEARLRAEVEAFLESCDEGDAREDEEFGPDGDGLSLPVELRDRAGAAEREGREYTPKTSLEEARPKDAEQINFSDEESRIMVSGGSFVQAFNAQAAVDTESHIVTAACVTNQAVDAPHLPALVREIVATLGRSPERVLADAGYDSAENLEFVSAVGAEAFILLDRVRHHQWRAQRSPRGRIPEGLSSQDRMRRKLATKAGKRCYLRRQASGEPVFEYTKSGRSLTQLLHRGIDKNHHLVRFDMAVHNILKIIRAFPKLFGMPRRECGTRAGRIPSAQALPLPA